MLLFLQPSFKQLDLKKNFIVYISKKFCNRVSNENFLHKDHLQTNVENLRAKPRTHLYMSPHVQTHKFKVTYLYRVFAVAFKIINEHA